MKNVLMSNYLITLKLEHSCCVPSAGGGLVCHLLPSLLPSFHFLQHREGGQCNQTESCCEETCSQNQQCAIMHPSVTKLGLFMFKLRSY